MQNIKENQKLNYLHSSLNKVLVESKELYIKIDPLSGLIAIVSIDCANLEYKSALGGTRCIYYPSIEDAILDAIKLSTTMTYKAKFADLPFNGGKVVLMKTSSTIDRYGYLLEYGKFIDSLEGRIITGCDSGVTPEDMKIAAQNTTYITALASHEGVDHLTSLTVMGVLEAMKAATEFQFNTSDLAGLKIAVQGLGKVGYLLARKLREQGAKVTITDIDLGKAHMFAQKYKTQVVEPSIIYKGEYDIFVPCGLGGVINKMTLNEIDTKIICGSANNTLASEEMDELLFKKNIIYVPDFISNIGGAVYAGRAYLGQSADESQRWIKDNIYQKVLNLLIYSKDYNMPCNYTAKYLMK